MNLSASMIRGDMIIFYQRRIKEHVWISLANGRVIRIRFFFTPVHKCYGGRRAGESNAASCQRLTMGEAEEHTYPKNEALDKFYSRATPTNLQKCDCSTTRSIYPVFLNVLAMYFFSIDCVSVVHLIQT